MSRGAVGGILVLALVALPSVMGAQRREPSSIQGARVVLAPTPHAALPEEVSQYWFVPGRPGVQPARPEAQGLARGVVAIASGDFAAALALVSNPELAKSVLSGYAKYYQGLALLGLSRLEEADAVFAGLAQDRPQGYLSEVARVKLAEVALGRGDAQRAERILRELAAESLLDPEDVVFKLARAEEAAFHQEHAIEAHRRVYFSFPLSSQAGDAKAALDRLEVGASIPPPLVNEVLARAERLFGARRWADARLAFDAVARAASGDDRELASIRLAECDFHLGRHRAAQNGLRPYVVGSSREAEARFYFLNATRRLGDRAGYLALVAKLVADHPQSEWAAEALNGLAVYYISADDDESADRVFRELVLRFPRHPHSERAAWKVGWTAYRGGRLAEAAEHFESAAVAFPRADHRPAWLYWSGRAREQLGDREAIALYQLTVADYGSSYYGRLASKILASTSLPPVPASRGIVVNLPVSLEAPPNEAVVRALLEVDLFDEAAREVRYAQRIWGDSPRLEATLAWIWHQQAQGLRAEERFAALRGAITTMRRAYPQFLTASGEDLPGDVLRIIYPLDYWDLIEKYATTHGLDPYLMAALVAQESTFTAEIRSSASARGLMQIIPSTGRRYALKLGIRPFTTASLLQPETNVRIGARYFKDLLDRFGGAHYALAGYNAGEGRVAQWLKDAPGLPADEFIDSIPFPETQNYVKRILGTAEDYRRLYGTGVLAPGTRRASAAAD